MQRPIVDTHIHFYQVSRPGGVPWPPREAGPRLFRDVLPAEYKALAARHGIVACGVVEASPLRPDNDWILSLIQNDDFFPFFVAELDLDAADFATEADRLARNPKVVGVRSWSPKALTLDERQLTNARALADRGMTLDLVSRGDVHPKTEIGKLAAAVPGLRIIIDHLGGAAGPAVEPGWERDIRAVAAHPNVYMKFSSFYDMYNGGTDTRPWQAPVELNAYRPHFDVLMSAFGADRLIWGSNWPVSDMGGDFGRQIALAEEYLTPHGTGVRDKVMGGNARSVYRRQRPQ